MSNHPFVHLHDLNVMIVMRNGDWYFWSKAMNLLKVVSETQHKLGLEEAQPDRAQIEIMQMDGATTLSAQKAVV